MIPSALSRAWEGLWRAPADADARHADFERLYELTRLQVRRTAYGMSGAEDLDDIVQEAYLRMWRSWDSFRADSDVKTWVYRITVNAVREHWRKKGRHRAALQRYAAEPRAQSQDAEPSALKAALQRALGALSPEHHEAVALCYLEGLSIAEAAVATGQPEGTIKSRLHYARRQLSQAGGEP